MLERPHRKLVEEMPRTYAEQRRPDRTIVPDQRLALRIHPDPVLRSLCEPVEEFDAALANLAEEMLAIMRTNNGIGLAAPQVGISRQLLVAEIAGQALSLANPRILDRSGSIALPEGCLSLPGQTVVVARDRAIRVLAYDLRGREVRIAASRLWARVIEHEIDHLGGVLIIDHAKAVARE